MKCASLITIVLFLGMLLASCSDYPHAPVLTLTSVDGSVLELDANTPLTALLFISVSNPVAIGALDRLPEQLDETADSVAIAMHVDRPPNIEYIQQRTLVPIVVDEANHIAEAFGGIELTPTLILVDKGRIVLHQRGRLDFQVINDVIDDL